MAAKKRATRKQTKPDTSPGTSLVPVERIQNAILLVRGEKVMLDEDLADLYGVGTKVLVQAVKRNLDRFPQDFMFRLSSEEFRILRSQSVTSRWGGRRYPPHAFTEQGVAMLSSVLRSDRAVGVNVEIMRAFVRIRRVIASHDDLARQLAKLEKSTDARFLGVFKAIRMLADESKRTRRLIEVSVERGKRRPIGFRPDAEKPE